MTINQQWQIDNFEKVCTVIIYYFKLRFDIEMKVAKFKIKIVISNQKDVQLIHRAP